MPADKHPDPRVAALVVWYETLSPQTLPALHSLYAADAWFKDPFNEVRGTAAIAAVFEHMFATLRAPRFEVLDIVAQDDRCFLTWHFHFTREGGAPWCIRGASHVAFDHAGRVSLHRDYWDAAEELYERLPLLGWLMRALKRRLKTP